LLNFIHKKFLGIFQFITTKAIMEGNVLACEFVVDALRNSVGPCGRDKIFKTERGETVQTNHGALIAALLKCEHPVASMLVRGALALVLFQFEQYNHPNLHEG
jgi:chaperonin GroEL (HSP60 family)